MVDLMVEKTVSLLAAATVEAGVGHSRKKKDCRGEKDVHGGCSTTGKSSIGAGGRLLWWS
jgi:hypothetical protein